MLVYLELWVVALITSLLVLTLPHLHPSAHSSLGLGWDLVMAALRMRSAEQRFQYFIHYVKHRTSSFCQKNLQNHFTFKKKHLTHRDKCLRFKVVCLITCLLFQFMHHLMGIRRSFSFDFQIERFICDLNTPMSNKDSFALCVLTAHNSVYYGFLTGFIFTKLRFLEIV